jgi:hypothetical protein
MSYPKQKSLGCGAKKSKVDRWLSAGESSNRESSAAWVVHGLGQSLPSPRVSRGGRDGGHLTRKGVRRKSWRKNLGRTAGRLPRQSAGDWARMHAAATPLTGPCYTSESALVKLMSSALRKWERLCTGPGTPTVDASLPGRFQDSGRDRCWPILRNGSIWGVGRIVSSR